MNPAHSNSRIAAEGALASTLYADIANNICSHPYLGAQNAQHQKRARSRWCAADRGVATRGTDTSNEAPDGFVSYSNSVVR